MSVTGRPEQIYEEIKKKTGRAETTIIGNYVRGVRGDGRMGVVDFGYSNWDRNLGKARLGKFLRGWI